MVQIVLEDDEANVPVEVDSIESIFPWEKCPPEIFLKVLDSLPNYFDLLSCCQVNRLWNKMAMDPWLYRSINALIFPGRGSICSISESTIDQSVSHQFQTVTIPMSKYFFKLLWRRSAGHLKFLYLEQDQDSYLHEILGRKTKLITHQLSHLELESGANLTKSDWLNLFGGHSKGVNHAIRSEDNGKNSLSVLMVKEAAREFGDDVMLQLTECNGLNLRTLVLLEAFDLSGRGLGSLWKNCSHSLVHLELDNCPSLHNFDFEFDSHRNNTTIFFPHLKRLKLSNMRSLDEDFLPGQSARGFLRSISRFCPLSCSSSSSLLLSDSNSIVPSLKCLELVNLCSSITDSAFLRALNPGSQAILLGLEVFSIAGGYCITDLSFELLFSTQIDDGEIDRERSPGWRVANWRSLDLTGCSRITDKTIYNLLMGLDACPNLRVLKVAECSGISGRALERLHQSRPQLSLIRW